MSISRSIAAQSAHGSPMPQDFSSGTGERPLRSARRDLPLVDPDIVRLHFGREALELADRVPLALAPPSTCACPAATGSKPPSASGDRTGSIRAKRARPSRPAFREALSSAMLPSPWRWTYARLFVRSRRQKDYSPPAWSAVVGVSVVMGMNLLAAAILAKMLIVPELAVGKAQALMVMLSLYLINFLRFVRGGSAKEIVERLEEETRAERRRDERKLWCYVLASLAVPFVLMFVSQLARPE